MSIEDKIDDKRMQDDINFNSRSMQEKSLEQEGKRCHNGTVAIQGWCPEVWDKIFCWPSTAPGELAAQPCPRYIAGFDSLANATKQCTSNGEWYWNPQTNSSWTNYTQCYRTQLVTVLMDISGVFPNNDTLIEKYFPIVKSISKVGYTLSFFTLLIALCILVTIKKLRCPRNVLHMHTFASFTMRAFMALLKDTLFVSGIGLAFDIVVKNGDSYFFRDNTESNWHCKLFTTFWQYFILANYFWILMEGLYLHNLVFRALFTDATSNVTPYVALGWGLPTIFVAVWALSRAIFENTFCWTINSNPYLFLLIRLPTVLSILINFVLFVNIVRVLFSKLKCTVCEETQRYKRWAKSTLVLVPLFGVHYTLFLGMSYSMKVHEKIELVWLFCDQFFASFQGFFVAVLYCFLNREVRAELSRSLRTNKCPRFRFVSKAAVHSNSVCSCNASKLAGHRRRPTRFARFWPCLCHDREVHRSTHSMASTQGVLFILLAYLNETPHFPSTCFPLDEKLSLTSSSALITLLRNDRSNRKRRREKKREEKRRKCYDTAHISDIATRGTSLASSRGYLHIVEDSPKAVPLDRRSTANHTSPLCSNYTDQSLLSFTSNISDTSTNTKIHERHRWSDSECCQQAHELHNLQHNRCH